MDERNEQDAVWNLLGKARKVEASPYFTRKVLQAVVKEQEKASFTFSQLLRWLAPVSVCAAVAIGWVAYSWQQDEMANFNACFDAAADIQSLIVQDDTSFWTGS